MTFQSATLLAQGTSEDYAVDSASLVQLGVPKGDYKIYLRSIHHIPRYVAGVQGVRPVTT